jgi:hypothetical protein
MAALFTPTDNITTHHHRNEEAIMKKSLKGAITAGAAGVILAGGLASPASAANIDSDFVVTGPGAGKCHEIILEFYTPGSGQHPRHEYMTKCGSGKLVRHYKSNHTHWRIIGNRVYPQR